MDNSSWKQQFLARRSNSTHAPLIPPPVYQRARQSAKFFSFFLVFCWASLAHANFYCTGKINYLGTDNALFISNGFGVHRLCELTEERCKAWLSMAMAAKLSDRVISIYYRSESSAGGEQANGRCKEIGSWVTPAEPVYHVAFQ